MNAENDIETAGEADRLLTAARTLMARGDDKFTVAAVCAEAGLGREAFRRHFAGREALIAALSRPAPPQTDMWLERRLRVFERALGMLEAQTAEAEKAQALAIARLEEKLASAAAREPDAAPMPVKAAPPPRPPVEKSLVEKSLAPLPDPLPPPVVPPPGPVTRAAVVEALDHARRAATPAPLPALKKKKRRRNHQAALVRWLAILALLLLTVLLCMTLLLGDPARATQFTGGNAHRVAASGVARLIARADSGDPAAQAALAFAYLRGTGVTRDDAAAARWSAAAAAGGDAMAQALAGTLAMHRDPRRAFGWLAAAAAQGNVKAMHNLAVAYAQGSGTAPDPSQAASWFARAASYGYVDSAFDLAVLYERGEGVRQSLRAALTWYGIAARAGDAPAAERTEVLRGQLGPAEVALAEAATARFAPQVPPAQANRLAF